MKMIDLRRYIRDGINNAEEEKSFLDPEAWDYSEHEGYFSGRIAAYQDILGFIESEENDDL